MPPPQRAPQPVRVSAIAEGPINWPLVFRYVPQGGDEDFVEDSVIMDICFPVHKDPLDFFRGLFVYILRTETGPHWRFEGPRETHFHATDTSQHTSMMRVWDPSNRTWPGVEAGFPASVVLVMRTARQAPGD